MDVVLGIYRDTTGSFPAWRPIARRTQGTEWGWFCWFLEVTLIVFLVIRGTELNPGFHIQQDKIETIIAT
jgi:hypothetical protein